MGVDPVIVASERAYSDVPLDFYFNPISQIFANKWNDSERLPLKQKIIEKCLLMASQHAQFSKIVCLLFFRDALCPQSSDESSLNLQTTVLAGARLLF